MNRDPKDWPGGVLPNGEPIQNDENNAAVERRRAKRLAARTKAKPLQDTAASHLRNALQITTGVRGSLHLIDYGIPDIRRGLDAADARIRAALAILEGKTNG